MWSGWLVRTCAPLKFPGLLDSERGESVKLA
jgi:hypothetical protein